MHEGNKVVVGEGWHGLVGAATHCFTAITELAKEAGFMCSAGAQVLTALLRVVNHPQVSSGLAELAILKVRDAKGELDSRRNRRERERQVNRYVDRHAPLEKIQRKHEEILNGKPVEVEKELKNNTNSLVPVPIPKKGLTHKLDLSQVTEKKQEEAR